MLENDGKWELCEFCFCIKQQKGWVHITRVQHNMILSCRLLFLLLLLLLLWFCVSVPSCLQSEGVRDKSFRHPLLSERGWRRALWALSYLWVRSLYPTSHNNHHNTFFPFNHFLLLPKFLCFLFLHHPFCSMLTCCYCFQAWCSAWTQSVLLVASLARWAFSTSHTSACMHVTTSQHPCCCLTSGADVLSGWRSSPWTLQQLWTAVRGDTSPSWRCWRLSGESVALHKETTWSCSANRM